LIAAPAAITRFSFLFLGNDIGNPMGASCSGHDATEHHYTGKEHDSESGNDYFFARYYTSALGRFVSPDWSAKNDPAPYAQLSDPQSLNLYSYVRNNPTIRIDPDGHGCNGWGCLEEAETEAAKELDKTEAQQKADALKKEAAQPAAQQTSEKNTTSGSSPAAADAAIGGHKAGKRLGQLIAPSVSLNDQGNGSGTFKMKIGSLVETVEVFLQDFAVTGISVIPIDGDPIFLNITNSGDGEFSISVSDVGRNAMYSISQADSNGRFTIAYGPIFEGKPMGVGAASLAQSLSQFVNAASSAGGDDATEVVNWKY
jgi:RHS repeat-associated protein